MTQTNMEAASEIARLMRVRDIGGIIIVDFIDMERDEHRKEVASVLEQELKQDRTKSYIVGWTKLGLLEITRKKVREEKTLVP
ncbi:Ribonuclease E [compost metagenome]